HPAAGIAYALERAGEPVLVCAADMPFVTADECRRLTAAFDRRSVAAVATADSRLQPVLGVYSQDAVRPLREAAKANAPLSAAVAALGPRLVELPAAALESVDTPDELRRATGSPPA
ncbi:MAG: molybdenum cofactor guanylyltransferase, partial [Thermoleophilaceae bacterium]